MSISAKLMAPFECAILLLLLTLLRPPPPVLALATVSAPTQTNKQTLGLLSFDLDDTLFPTSEVVNDANFVMIKRMRDAGFPTTVQDFLDTTRAVRKTLDAPITYSDLRRLAIETEMKRLIKSNNNNSVEGGVGNMINTELVEECFDVWLWERHRAAERHLFEDAIDMLEEVRRLHPGVCIAAITNGRGNPLDMTSTLQPYFDFSVSGEDDDVFPHRKPFPQIYDTAWERYQSLHSHRSPADSVWCHVGDCLANDVGASSECGALAVWYNPSSANNNDKMEESAASRLVIPSSSLSSATTTTTPSWSTATQEDLKERAALATEGRQKVSAQIASLSDLPDTIEQLLLPRR